MQSEEQGFSFKSLFVPITTLKAIVWIVVIGLIIYSNSLFNGFIADDFFLIIKNPLMQSFHNIPLFFSGGVFNDGGHLVGRFYRPIPSVYLSILYSIFAGNSSLYHFFQIILHITNAVIVFGLFGKFLKKQTSFILALIFLLHPINSETVFYISAIPDILFFFFGILAFYILLNKVSGKYLIFVLLCLLFSLLSKETGILFLGIILLYSCMFQRKYLFPILIVLLLIISVYIPLRFHAIGLSTQLTVSPISQLSLLGRFITMPEIFFFYVRTFLFPWNLAYVYQYAYQTISFTTFVLPLGIDLLFLSIVGFIGLKLSKRSVPLFKMYVFFAIWFFLGILIHIQILPLDLTVAERWFYFPIVGLLGVMGAAWEGFHIRFNKVVLICLIVIILVFFSLRVYVRSYDWRNEFTLDSHDTLVSDNYSNENGLAVEYLNQGKLIQAKLHAEKSVKLYPYLLNSGNLGYIYMKLGDYKAARKEYINALRFGDYIVIYEDLAALGLVDGRTNDTIGIIKSGLRKYPTDYKLWLILGVIDYNAHNLNEAKYAIGQAYALSHDPGIGSIYNYILNNKPISNLELYKALID